MKSSSYISSLSTSSSNQSIDSSPNAESLDFFSIEKREPWKKEVIKCFYDAVAEIDEEGKILNIPEGEIIETLGLDSPLLTKTEMKKISEVLWNRPWPSYEEADRTSIYTRLWNLIEKHRRPDP